MSIDNRIVVPMAGLPCVDAHGVTQGDAMHFCRATEREFYHFPSFASPCAPDPVERPSVTELFSVRFTAERIFRCGVAAGSV